MTLVVTDWEEGFDKVGLNILLRETAGLRLAAAKQAVDGLLDGRAIQVDFANEARATEFYQRALNLRCKVSVMVAPEFSARGPETAGETLAVPPPRSQSGFSKKPAATFQIFLDATGEYRWRLRARNNEIIATSVEGYKSKADCHHRIEVLKRDAQSAIIEEIAERATA